MQAYIQLHQLTKTYHVRERNGFFATRRRSIHALDAINLDIERGTFLGLLGPNGAGKTTLVKCLTTQLRPSSGTITVAGYDVAQAPAQARSAIGAMPMDERKLSGKRTGRDQLASAAARQRVPRRERDTSSARLVDRLRMQEFIDRPAASYAPWQQMKLAVACALVHDAPILVLDEPTNTLDVSSARELHVLLAELHDEGRTIVYTTHVISEAETLCQQLAIIDRGRLIAQGTPAALKLQAVATEVIHVRGQIPPRATLSVQALPSVREVAIAAVDDHHELAVKTSEPRQVLPRLIETLYAYGASIEDIVPTRTTLEDVFVTLTGRPLAEDTSTRQA
ncbi:MAG TPA: ABC transporter ATP-binding protein [Herpetosiphonaceae bacterium]